MAGISGNESGIGLLSTILNSPNVSANGCSPRSLQTLAYEEVRTSTERPYDSTVFIIHGLLGWGRSWRSFSQNLLSGLSNSSSSEWRVVLVDLRNHWGSADVEGFDPPHDMVNTAKDLANLIESQGWAWPDVVMGHSMGAKVALQFAQSCNSGDYGHSASLPKQLWVLDTVPGNVNSENTNVNSETTDGGVEILLKTLQGFPSLVPSREWVFDHMIELGFPKPVSKWIVCNLKKSGDHQTWNFNLEGVVQMFDSYRETSYWSLLEHPPKDMEMVVVRAENNDDWTPEVVQQLESLSSDGLKEFRGHVSVHVLPNSAHWVHVDNPKGLLDIVVPKISSL